MLSLLPALPALWTALEVAAVGLVAYGVFLFVRNNYLGGLERDHAPPRTPDRAPQPGGPAADAGRDLTSDAVGASRCGAGVCASGGASTSPRDVVARHRAPAVRPAQQRRRRHGPLPRDAARVAPAGHRRAAGQPGRRGRQQVLLHLRPGGHCASPRGRPQPSGDRGG